MQIPNLLIGQPVANAQEQLEKLNLKVKVVQVDSEKPKDTVTAVSPAMGTTVAEGQEVTLSVSKENRKAVPEIKDKGYSSDFAKGLLANAGFTKVTVVFRDVNDPDQNNIALDVDPAGGSVRDPATEVTLFVGRYTAPSNPPSSSSSPGPG